MIATTTMWFAMLRRVPDLEEVTARSGFEGDEDDRFSAGKSAASESNRTQLAAPRRDRDRVGHRRLLAAAVSMRPPRGASRPPATTARHRATQSFKAPNEGLLLHHPGNDDEPASRMPRQQFLRQPRPAPRRSRLAGSSAR